LLLAAGLSALLTTLLAGLLPLLLVTLLSALAALLVLLAALLTALILPWFCCVILHFLTTGLKLITNRAPAFYVPHRRINSSLQREVSFDMCA
jgi:hypothetical protein